MRTVYFDASYAAVGVEIVDGVGRLRGVEGMDALAVQESPSAHLHPRHRLHLYLQSLLVLSAHEAGHTGAKVSSRCALVDSAPRTY